MTVVIAGASGLLGSEVVSLWKEKGWHVATLGRRPGGNSSTVRHIYADLSRPLNAQVLPKNVDVVMHLAQSRLLRDFPNSGRDVHSINTESAVQLLEYAIEAGAKTYVYASSGAVYAPSDQPLSEKSRLRGLSDHDGYSSSKLAAEVLLAPYMAHINLVILRPFFIYGPNQSPDRLLPRLRDKIERSETIEISGSRGLVLNPIHVVDAAAAVLHCINLNSSLVMNLAGPETLTLEDMIGQLADRIGKVAKIRRISGESGSLVGDIAMLKESGFLPRIDFATGAALTINSAVALDQ